jgi:hypothetical protein
MHPITIDEICDKRMMSPPSKRKKVSSEKESPEKERMIVDCSEKEEI